MLNKLERREGHLGGCLESRNNKKINIIHRMETAEVDELISIFNVSASGQLSKVNNDNTQFQPDNESNQK